MESGEDRQSRPQGQGPLDIEELRHRTEPSRFALAVSACGLVLALANYVAVAALGPVQLLAAGVFLLVFLASLWLMVQLVRVRNLAAAVRVTSESFPQVQAAVDEVRQKLSYDRRTEVFIVDKCVPRVAYGSYFGYHVIIMEGSVVADLTVEEKHADLIFLLATYFGALKAQHTRWTVALIVFEGFGILKFMNPFIRPWYRSTTFTGDQIAYACCEDLNVSIDVIHQRLVGKEMASQLQANGLVGQANRVRSHWILRLSQILAAQPHPTNRYLNLLAFAGTRTPADLERFAEGLSAKRAETLNQSLHQFPVRRPSVAPATWGLAVAAVLVAASAVGGLATYDSLQSAASGENTGSVGLPSDTTPTETEPTLTEPTETEPTETEPTETEDPLLPVGYEELVGRLPAQIGRTCYDSTSYERVDRPLIAFSVECSPPAVEPGGLTLYQYDELVNVGKNFDIWVEGVGAGDCSEGIPDGGGPWQNGEQIEQGRLGCYVVDEQSVIVWTDVDLRAVLVAYSERASLQGLYDWWSNHAYLGEPY